MITFKTATTSYTEVIALLGRITYTESHGHFIDDKNDLLAYCANAFSIKKITEELEDKNNLFHIAYVDDLPVGFSKVVLNYPFEDKTANNSARLERIYILNDFIQQKLGYKFLQFIEQEAKFPLTPRNLYPVRRTCFGGLGTGQLLLKIGSGLHQTNLRNLKS